MASPSAGAPALNYGDVNTETTSPGEVKGLNKIIHHEEILFDKLIEIMMKINYFVVYPHIFGTESIMKKLDYL